MTTRTANLPASDRMAAGRKTMLAGHLPLHPRRFASEDVAVPKPRPVEVVIGVKAAAGCRSDVHLINATLSPWNKPSRAATFGHKGKQIRRHFGASFQRIDPPVGDPTTLVPVP